MIRNLLFGGALALACSPAFAHGPWPAECCSDRDCAEVPSRFVRLDGDRVHIRIPPGVHPMWPEDGRAPFVATVPFASVRDARTTSGMWGVCIGPHGTLFCVFQASGGM